MLDCLLTNSYADCGVTTARQYSDCYCPEDGSVQPFSLSFGLFHPLFMNVTETSKGVVPIFLFKAEYLAATRSEHLEHP